MKKRIFINDKHEFNLKSKDGTYNTRLYKLKTTDSNIWTDEARNKVVLTAFDTGNGVRLQFLDNPQAPHITLDYSELQNLYILLQIFEKEQTTVPDVIEIKPSKKEQKERLTQMMKQDENDGNFGL
jgi:hypothetical protein